MLGMHELQARAGGEGLFYKACYNLTAGNEITLWASSPTCWGGGGGGMSWVSHFERGLRCLGACVSSEGPCLLVKFDLGKGLHELAPVPSVCAVGLGWPQSPLWLSVAVEPSCLAICFCSVQWKVTCSHSVHLWLNNQGTRVQSPFFLLTLTTHVLEERKTSFCSNVCDFTF